MDIVILVATDAADLEGHIINRSLVTRLANLFFVSPKQWKFRVTAVVEKVLGPVRRFVTQAAIVAI